MDVAVHEADARQCFPCNRLRVRNKTFIVHTVLTRLVKRKDRPPFFRIAQSKTAIGSRLEGVQPTAVHGA